MERSVVIRLLALTALVPLVVACPRRVRVESEGRQPFTVEVRNPMPYGMVVSYDDGTGRRLLGTVAAGGVQRFTILGTGGQAITIRGEAQDRSGRSVQRVVRLEAGSSAVVDLGGG